MCATFGYRERTTKRCWVVCSCRMSNVHTHVNLQLSLCIMVCLFIPFYFKQLDGFTLLFLVQSLNGQSTFKSNVSTFEILKTYQFTGETGENEKRDPLTLCRAESAGGLWRLRLCECVKSKQKFWIIYSLYGTLKMQFSSDRREGEGNNWVRRRH